jgi:hypothetical protein
MAGGARPAHTGGMNGTSLTHPDCQVLVVGVGPTGLVLAAELTAGATGNRPP